MNAVSLFAGVGGFDLALERNGIPVVASVEIDKHARKILERHFPNSLILNDVTEVSGEQLINAGFDPQDGVIVGGFPCQDVSVAGKRAGLTHSDGTSTRTGLFWHIVRLLEETKAKYFILENVPGLLSSNNGRDFGTVIGALDELGYGVSWRILDAKYHGVPQRRQRVFIIGCLGDGRTPGEILNLIEGRRRYVEEGATKREDTPQSFITDIDDKQFELIPFHPHRSDGVRLLGQTSNTLSAFMGTGGLNTIMLAFAFHGGMVGRKEKNGPSGSGFMPENMPAYTLAASSQSRHGAVTSQGVRRFTPIEYERLQGFPDNWTAGQTDGHRYKQMGNAVAVPVVEAIVKRLAEVANG
jgi:DNA (cytosine-5)-methyltransferase 1